MGEFCCMEENSIVFVLKEEVWLNYTEIWVILKASLLGLTPCELVSPPFPRYELTW